MERALWFRRTLDAQLDEAKIAMGDPVAEGVGLLGAERLLVRCPAAARQKWRRNPGVRFAADAAARGGRSNDYLWRHGAWVHLLSLARSRPGLSGRPIRVGTVKWQQ